MLKAKKARIFFIIRGCNNDMKSRRWTTSSLIHTSVLTCRLVILIMICLMCLKAIFTVSWTRQKVRGNGWKNRKKWTEGKRKISTLLKKVSILCCRYFFVSRKTLINKGLEWCPQRATHFYINNCYYWIFVIFLFQTCHVLCNVLCYKKYRNFTYWKYYLRVHLSNPVIKKPTGAMGKWRFWCCFTRWTEIAHPQ